MCKEEELTREYKKNRISLEEQEELVLQTMRRAESYSQDIWEQINQLLRKKGRSMEPLMEVQQKLQRNEANYIDELTQDRKNIREKQENLDRIYRKEFQDLKK